MRSTILRNTLFTFAACMIGLVSFAQNKQITGTIVDSATKQAIPLASILNVLSGNVLISKSDGSFSADVYEGQIFAFSANGYYSDTFYITGAMVASGLMQVQLKPIRGTLQDVTVVAGSNDIYQNDSLQRRRYFLQTV
eukprot:gene10695-14344_t